MEKEFCLAECSKLILFVIDDIQGVVLKLSTRAVDIFHIQIGLLIHIRLFHRISKQLLSLVTKHRLVLDYNSPPAAVSILQ